MDHEFKSLSTHKVIDLIPYIKNQQELRDDISIYVGCDSQNHGKYTVCAAVIVLHHKANGGHILYTKKSIPRIHDRWARLWNEVEISVEIAEYLKKHEINADKIDIDLNPDPKYGSNSVFRAAMGFVESYGYTARAKPAAVSASYCADRLCK